MRTEYTIDQLQIIVEEVGYRFTKVQILASCTYAGNTYYAELVKDESSITDALLNNHSHLDVKREIVEHDGKPYTFRVDPNSAFLKPLKWTLVPRMNYREFEIYMDKCFDDAKESIQCKLDEYKRKLKIMSEGTEESSNS